jgi:hypothetical protein
MPVLYKLLSGFLVLILMIATLGGHAIYSVSNMGSMAIAMYDRPLMAINFSRAASTDFAQINAAIARVKGLAADAPDTENPAADAPDTENSAADAPDTESPAAAQIALIEEYLENFSDNIEVANERALSEDSRALSTICSLGVTPRSESNRQISSVAGRVHGTLTDPTNCVTLTSLDI